VEQSLTPALEPGDVVILDNQGSYFVSRVLTLGLEPGRETFEARGGVSGA